MNTNKILLRYRWECDTDLEFYKQFIELEPNACNIILNERFVRDILIVEILYSVFCGVSKYFCENPANRISYCELRDNLLTDRHNWFLNKLFKKTNGILIGRLLWQNVWLTNIPIPTIYTDKNIFKMEWPQLKEPHPLWKQTNLFLALIWWNYFKLKTFIYHYFRSRK